MFELDAVLNGDQVNVGSSLRCFHSICEIQDSAKFDDFFSTSLLAEHVLNASLPNASRCLDDKEASNSNQYPQGNLVDESEQERFVALQCASSTFGLQNVPANGAAFYPPGESNATAAAQRSNLSDDSSTLDWIAETLEEQEAANRQATGAILSFDQFAQSIDSAGSMPSLASKKLTKESRSKQNKRRKHVRQQAAFAAFSIDVDPTSDEQLSLQLHRNVFALSNGLIADCHDLIRLSVRELNKRLQGLGAARIRELKQHRRTFKNRGYARKCRIRRLQQHQNLQEVCETLKLKCQSLETHLQSARKQAEYYRQLYSDINRELTYCKSAAKSTYFDKFCDISY